MIGSTRPIAEVQGHDSPFTGEDLCLFAEWADKLGGEQVATSYSKFAAALHEPYGAVGAIAPPPGRHRLGQSVRPHQ